MEKDIPRVHSRISKYVSNGAFDSKQDFEELVGRPFIDLIIFEMYKESHVEIDTVRETMEVSTFLFLSFLEI